MFEKRRQHDHCSAARMRFSLQGQHVQQLIKNHGGAASARETQGSVTNRDLSPTKNCFWPVYHTSHLLCGSRTDEIQYTRLEDAKINHAENAREILPLD